MWDLIVLVPDFAFLFTYIRQLTATHKTGQTHKAQPTQDTKNATLSLPQKASQVNTEEEYSYTGNVIQSNGLHNAKGTVLLYISKKIQDLECVFLFRI